MGYVTLIINFGRKNDKVRNECMIQLYFASSQSENKIQYIIEVNVAYNFFS